MDWKMSDIILNPDIEAFVREVTVPFTEVMDDLERETRARCPHPEMMTGRVEGQLLRFLTLMVQPKVAVELGTFTGYGSLSIASALPDDGVLYTFDRDERSSRLAKRYFARVPFGKKIVPVMGDARDRVHDLQWKVDLAFIDADKAAYDYYYEIMLERLRPGGIIIIDNTLWSGDVILPVDETAKVMYELDHKIAQDERVDSILLTVRDGVTLVRKR